MNRTEINDMMVELERSINKATRLAEEHEREVFALDTDKATDFEGSKWWKAHTAVELIKGMTYTKLAISDLLKNCVID